MDKHVQKLLREYSISPTDELAHRISHAVLRSRAPSIESEMYCPKCHSLTVFATLSSGAAYCTSCGWDPNEPDAQLPPKICGVCGIEFRGEFHCSTDDDSEKANYCPPCLAPEHNCSMTEGCPCCEASAQYMGLSLPLLEEEEEEDIEECPRCDYELAEPEDLTTTDEGEQACVRCHQSNQEGCAHCGDDLWDWDEHETWTYVNEEAADLLGVDEGSMICLECLQQVNIYDLSDAAMEE